MFESDDFDQVLSQLDYSDSISESKITTINKAVHQGKQSEKISTKYDKIAFSKHPLQNIENSNSITRITYPVYKSNIPLDLEDYDQIVLNKDYDGNIPQASNRKTKMLSDFFDHRSKRKFPGPAGLLSPALGRQGSNNNLSQVEIFSQDVECSQGRLHPEVFESVLWRRLQNDLRSWGALRIDPIDCVKRLQLAGCRPSRKAHLITAFVEAVDRSAIDSVIILRDSSGTIKCTLHRDAWSVFSPYMISELAAMALWKPTVLTTGTQAFKKHYLTITLSNIIAIYSSKCNKILHDDERQMPNGYTKQCIDDITMIKMESCPQLENDITSVDASEIKKSEVPTGTSEDHLEGLDSLSFLDDVF